MNTILKFLIIFFIAGCTGSNANLEAKNIVSDKSTFQEFNLQDGLYYAYKNCLQKNIAKNGACIQGKEGVWGPLKTDRYLTSIDSRTIPDDFYLLKNGNKTSIYYTQRLVEAWVIGWADVNVAVKGNVLTVTPIKYIQTNGFPQFGSDSEEAIIKLGFNLLKSSEVVGVQKNGLELPFQFTLPFVAVSEEELSLDCIQYQKINKAKNDFGPLSELCSLSPLVSKIWLKKIATTEELAQMNLVSSVDEKNNEFKRVDFGGYGSREDVDNCAFNYGLINYCDIKHVSLYKKTLLNKKIDFNQSFIVLPILEYQNPNQYSLVIINSNTGLVYPLPIDWYEKKVGGKEAIQYSLENNQICINGGLHHWKVDENGRFCFQFDGKKFIGHNTNYMQ